MTKRSAFSKIAMAFVICYALYSAAFNVFMAVTDYTKDDARRLQNESFYAKIGHVLLDQKNIDDLEDRLNDALNADQIGFYSIRQNGKDVAFASASGAHDAIQLPMNGQNADIAFAQSGYRYFVVVANSYQLAIGHKTGVWAYISSYWNVQKDALIKDLLFVTLLTVLLVVYSFRDFFVILRRLKTVGLKRGDESIAKSSETLTLVKGLQGFENKIGKLESENLLFKNQVLPALRKELESGQEAPYEFSCTLVRADINNFTMIFTNHDRAEFMATINEFFIGVTHIVSRYEGFVHEFIGDEVIFYFKDNDHENSAAMAISAITDINHLAVEIDEKTRSARGYGFKIKSSLAHGTLRFGQLVNGYSLAGAPLIESVRMLSHVHEKSDNVTVMDETVQAHTGWICATRELGFVLLKGLKGSRRLYHLEDIAPLSLHLRQQTDVALANIRYYRSDESVAEIITHLREHRLELSETAPQTFLATLRQIPMTNQTAKSVRSAYLALLDELIEDTQGSAHLLASVVALATTLISADAFYGRLMERLTDCLSHKDQRVAANAVEVFSALYPQHQDRIFKTLAEGSSTNRIRANLLVKDAKSGWDRSIAKRLKALLGGPSPFDKASALYALGEIAFNLRALDDVAFRTSLQLQVFLDKAEQMTTHANAMVRRQAIQALEKSGRREATVVITRASIVADPHLKIAR